MYNKYYYLVASLPYLKFGEALPVSRDEFLSECGKWLDRKSLDALTSVEASDLTERNADGEVTREWKAFDLELRRELAKVRQIMKTGGRGKTPAFLKDTFEERTPLLMENRIQKMRWDFLEEKEFDYHFDLSALILYSLKLQILERRAAFEKEKGKTVFEGLCEVKYE